MGVVAARRLLVFSKYFAPVPKKVSPLGKNALFFSAGVTEVRHDAQRSVEGLVAPARVRVPVRGGGDEHDAPRRRVIMMLRGSARDEERHQ